MYVNVAVNPFIVDILLLMSLFALLQIFFFSRTSFSFIVFAGSSSPLSLYPIFFCPSPFGFTVYFIYTIACLISKLTAKLVRFRQFYIVFAFKINAKLLEDKKHTTITMADMHMLIVTM